MSKAARYIFIGGPQHLSTNVTDGSYYWRCVETIPTASKPVPAGQVLNTVLDGGFKEHLYVLTQFDIMGSRRLFYVSQELKSYKAEEKVGLLIASLIDLYAAS